jgi:AcrR family transcriptional regulator
MSAPDRSRTSSPAGGEGAARTVRLPRAERRRQLVDAAAAAFLAKGHDATTVEEVAERAGVSRLIVYRHFAGKEDLYRAVLTSVTEQLRARVDTDHPVGIVATLVDIARARPDAFRLLWRHARHEPPFADEAELFRLVAADHADGIVGRRGVDPSFRRWVASAVVDHLLEGICAWLDIGDPSLDDEFATRLLGGARSMVEAWS